MTLELRTGSVVQFTAADIVTAPIAFWFEDMHVRWDAESAFALPWLVLVLSLGAVPQTKPTAAGSRT